jgi:DNA adenine methylase
LDVDRVRVRSPLRYPGGKSRVARRLGRYIPEHADYREIFVGGGAIFFHKNKARRNWINDLHPGLYALWKTLRDHVDDFVELCEQQDTSDLRATFQYWIDRQDLMKADGDEHLVERAVQYFFINRTVWSGRVVYDPARRSRLYFSNPGGWRLLEKRMALIRKCAAKLHKVKITQLPFEKCVGRASADTFIYADPPYYRDSLDSPTSKLYEGHFAIEEHELLRDLLAETPAKAMISYDDRPEVRKLYRDRSKWKIIPLQWKYCGRYAKTEEQRARGEKERKVSGQELLILNYKPPRGASPEL